jgi:hypothetical protein
VKVEHHEPGVEIKARAGGSVEHAPERPLAEVLQSERGASDVERQLTRGGAQPLGHRGRGREQHRHNVGERRLAATRADGPERFAKRRSLGLSDGFADRRGRDRTQQLDLCVLLRASGERVDPHPAARDKGDRLDAGGPTERTVFALDIEHERTPAEQQHPPQERLDQRALALAQLAQHDRIGIVEGAPLIQGPGIEAEGATVPISADVHPIAAESAARRERVDRLGVTGRQPVRRSCGSDAHRSPRAKGSVNVNASAC